MPRCADFFLALYNYVVGAAAGSKAKGRGKCRGKKGIGPPKGGPHFLFN